jgi:HK97 family phage prohead protease
LKTITRKAAFDRITKSLAEDFRSATSAAAEDTEAQALQSVKVCLSTCYAAMNYGYDLGEVVTDAIYFALVDCYEAHYLLLSQMRRDSALASIGAELCVAACANTIAAIADSTDPILGAVVKACTTSSAACASMNTEGEAEEKRSAGAGKVETRSFHAELRAKADGAAAPTSITGYPIVFGQQSEELPDGNGGSFREIVAPGSVQFTSDVRADFNHSRDYILGRTTKGTLKLTVDAKGVLMDATAPDTQWARDLMTQIGRGDIDQGSFEFRILPGGVTWNVDRSVRTLTKILVSRVSVVSDPAYVQTGMSVRDLQSVPVVLPLVDADLMGRLLDLRLQEA